MNKAIPIMAILLLLSITLVSATLVKPNITPVDPLPGATVSGNYTLKVKVEYPQQDGDRIDIKQIMFRYIRQNCTNNCKVVIGNDLSEAFGWSRDWDTTTVPDGTYDLQYYGFAEGGEILLAQTLVEDVTIDQSYQRPVEKPEEAPPANVTAPPVVQNKTETPKVENKTTNKTVTPPKAPEKPKVSFWTRFLTWIKGLFVGKTPTK